MSNITQKEINAIGRVLDQEGIDFFLYRVFCHVELQAHRLAARGDSFGSRKMIDEANVIADARKRIERMRSGS